MRDSSEFFVRDQQTALTTSTNMMRACPPTYHLERTQRVMIQSTASHKRHSMQISVRKSEQNKCVHLVLFMDRPVNWAMGSACDRCLAQLLGAVYVPSTVPTVDWVVLGFVESHREAAMSAACLQTHCRNMIIIITRFPVLRTRYVKQHRRNIVYYDSDVMVYAEELAVRPLWQGLSWYVCERPPESEPDCIPTDTSCHVPSCLSILHRCWPSESTGVR